MSEDAKSLASRIMETMSAYQKSRIDSELRKRAEEEKTGKPTGWNREIENTIFLWLHNVIANDVKSDIDSTMQALKLLTESGSLERHEEFTGCYYIPLVTK